jgi:hypothetical protein
MSTPIRQEVSPEDPKFYAPPRWRRGEVVAPSIQPSLRPAEFSGPQAYPDWTSQHGDEVLADERGRSTYKRAVDALPKGRQLSARRGSTNMRVTALAIAAGVVLWTAVCVALALGRLDVINFEQLRNGLPLAKGAETSAVAAPQTVNLALAETPKEVVAPTLAKEVVTPTLAVADAIGESNAALPLAITVTNATPGTTITLSGLAAGTKLNSGAVLGEGQWRIALEDQSGANDSLRNTFVTPPSDFVGLMRPRSPPRRLCPCQLTTALRQKRPCSHGRMSRQQTQCRRNPKCGNTYPALQKRMRPGISTSRKNGRTVRPPSRRIRRQP